MSKLVFPSNASKFWVRIHRKLRSSQIPGSRKQDAQGRRLLAQAPTEPIGAEEVCLETHWQGLLRPLSSLWQSKRSLYHYPSARKSEKSPAPWASLVWCRYYAVHGLLIPVGDTGIIEDLVRVCILRFLPHPQIWHQHLGPHWAFGQLAKGLTQGQEFLWLFALAPLDVSIAARWSIQVAWPRLAMLSGKGPTGSYLQSAHCCLAQLFPGHCGTYQL